MLADAHTAFPLGSGPSTLCLSRRAFGRRPKFGHPLAEPRANEAEALESRYVGNLLQRHAASFGLKQETSNDVEKAAEEAPSHKAEPASNDGSFGHPEACECLAASQCTDAHSVLRTLCPVLARCAGVPACGSCMATACQFCHLEHTRQAGRLLLLEPANSSLSRAALVAGPRGSLTSGSASASTP